MQFRSLRDFSKLRRGISHLKRANRVKCNVRAEAREVVGYFVVENGSETLEMGRGE